MGRPPSDALRARVGLVAPAPRPVAAADEERRTPDLLTEAAESCTSVCAAEVEARLAVLLRWM